MDRGDTRLCMSQKREIYGYFFTVFRKFSRKNNKKYSTENEEWIESETATVTSDYVLHNHLSISKAHLQTEQMHPPKNEQYFYFSLTLKDTEIL